MQAHQSITLIAALAAICLFGTPAAGRCSNCTLSTQTFTSSLGYLQTYYAAGSQYALGVANSTVTTAIFVIHGTSRDGNITYCYVDRGILDSTNVTLDRSTFLIIAPEFPQVVDGPPANYIYWEDDSWKEAGNSSVTLGATMSSFSLFDEMLSIVINKTIYPSMTKIIVIGHSAGGQFAHRYAVSNHFEPRANAVGISMVYGVANPSSVTYFDSNRPTNLPAGVCGSYCNPGEVELLNYQFGASPNVANCSTAYDKWPYGMTNRYPYLAAGTPTTLKNQYGPRKVYYILGSADTCNSLLACGCNDTGLDQSCAANAQGWCRLSRGYAYFAYLKSLAIPNFNHEILEVPGLGHVSCSALQAYYVLLVVYGGSPTPSTPAPTTPVPSSTSATTTPPPTSTSSASTLFSIALLFSLFVVSILMTMF